VGGRDPGWRRVVRDRPAASPGLVLGMLGMVEAYVGVERVGVAEVLTPAEAATRVAAARPKGTGTAGVLRPLPRREEPPR